MEVMLVVGLLSTLLLLFVALSVAVKLAEGFVPGLSEWLDEHVGPDPVWDER